MAETPRAAAAALLHVPHPASWVVRADAAAAQPAAVLGVSLTTLFVLGVSATGINAALPAIAADIGAGVTALSWAVGIYLLAVAAFVAPGGRLGDLIGERATVLVGLAVFGGATVMVAISNEPWVMIVARALQGLGTAILLPATVAVLRIGYPRERQDDALGVWGAVGGLSFAVGPLLGGALTDTVGWRWLWWSTAIVVGAVALAAVPVLSSLPTPQRRPRQDVGGIVLLAVSLFALILAIQQGPTWGWASAPTIGALAASAIGLVLLVRLENRHDEPLLHLRLLRSSRLVAANLVAFVNVLVLIGILFFFNLYTQAGLALDYSALTASLALLPYAAAAFGASLVAGRWCDRAGFTVPVTCGLLLMGVGGLLLGLLGTHSGYAGLWWPSTILGLGVGVTSVAPFAVGLSAVGADRAGEVSGIINVVRYLAAALVVSAGTVLFTAVGARHVNAPLAAADLPPAELGHLDAVLTGAPERIAAVERELGLSTAQVSTYEAGAAAGVAGGFAAVMLGLGAISLAATGAWLVLARRTSAAGSGGAAVGDR